MPRSLLVLLLLAAPALAEPPPFDSARIAGELKSMDPAVRRRAVELLDGMATETVAPALARALDDDDDEVRARAAVLAGQRRLVGLAPKIVGLLGSADTKARTAAAQALGAFGARLPADAQAALERALGDAESEVRAAALAALGRLPPAALKRALSALIGRLDDDNTSVRQRAAEVLGRSGDPRAVVPLIGRLSDTSRDVRRAALESLALIGDPRAATSVVRILDDVAPDVRAHAVDALGRLGGPEAAAPLIAVLGRPADPLAARAAVALGRVAGSLPASQPGAARLAGEAIEALLAALGRDELRGAAREGLGLAGAAAAPRLAQALPTAAGETASAIAAALAEAGGPAALAALRDELGRQRLGRLELAAAMARLVEGGERGALVDLVSLLDDGDAAVRRRAVAGLAGRADGRATAALLRAADDADGEVRLAALAELARLAPRGVTRPLAALLRHEDEATRAAAAVALGRTGDRAALGPLLGALESPSARVRRVAADAVGALGGPDAVSALVRLASTLPPERRPDAIAALGAALRGHPQPLARDVLLAGAEAGPPGIAVESVQALAAMADPSAAPRLLRLLERRTTATPLRRALVATLGGLGGAVDLRVLAARLESDADATVRAEAAWALGRRAGGPGRDEAEGHLVRALGSPQAAVRTNAAAGLARFALTRPLGKAARAALLGRLADESAAVRANAALALRGHAPARATLVQLREADEDARVRDAARRALEAAPAADDRDFIVIHVVDFDRQPLAGAPYELTLPDGRVRSGVTGLQGTLRVEGLPRGRCELVLP